MSDRLQFNFGKDPPPREKTGLELMHEQVRAAWRDWAAAMGLPLHADVEVVLYRGRSSL